MELWIGLLSLAGLSLFLSRLTARSSAVTPLVAVSAAMVWFLVAGCLDLLVAGGIAWYALCAAALVWVVWKEKKNLRRLITPGFVFFVAGSGLFILLFFVTRPLLTQWDEFTFWGTAARAMCENNRLYTLAQSNLIARSYPPGLPGFHYMMEFFGPWGEYKLMASMAVVQLAALAAPSALWGKNRPGAAVFLGGMLALPFFFEQAGLASWSFLSCLSDAPMAALFGGALCLYFAGGEKDHKLLLMLYVVLAALASVKDMGLALALIVLFVAVVDMLACERKTLRFFGLRRFWGAGAAFVAGALAVAGAYLLWAAHLSGAPVPVNRFDLGNREQSLDMLDMLLAGLGALTGQRSDPHFSATLRRMLAALADPARPVFLLGPGLVMLALVLGVSAAAWLCAATRKARRRVLVFTLCMAFCFAAFYVFNVFTYTYILKGAESEQLKDYHRYIYPFWMGWLMGAMALLAAAAADVRALRLRVQLGRFASLALSVALVAAVAALGNRESNFLLVSPSRYDQRLSVQRTLREAQTQGMRREDTVYLVCQGDDTTRFYMLGYEMKAKRDFLYVGKERLPLTDEAGSPVLNKKGNPAYQWVYYGNAAASLVAPDDASGYYEYAVPCTPEDLTAYLKQQGCTHLLLDVPDEYIRQAFGPLFSDGMEGWQFTQQGVVPGHRYYRIEWQPDGSCRFVPEGGQAA